MEKDDALLQAVKVDGTQLVSGEYLAESGSTIVTLYGSYLDRLSVGAHSLCVEYTDGVVVEGQFTVAAAIADSENDNNGTDGNDSNSGNADDSDSIDGNPQTGDNSNITMWFVLLYASVLGFIMTFILKKHEQQNQKYHRSKY
ncbi:MAG: hypothetical protein LBL54_00415 [Clostridiales Family XIII bacterium]|nr:hypothetical protein [Clostridiales Family XIII bacterium]